MRRVYALIFRRKPLVLAYVNVVMHVVSKTPVCQQTVTVKLENGLHLRPQSQIAQLAQQFDCDVNIRVDDRTVNAKSMFDLMTLQAAHGAKLCLKASGANAAEAIRQLVELFESDFEIDDSSSP